MRVLRASLVVRNLPAMWETQVRFLGQEDPLEEEMATHSSILAWKILWSEDPGGLQSVGLQRVRTGPRDYTFIATRYSMTSFFAY